MTSHLSTRLDRMECKVPGPQKQRRVIRIIAGQGDDGAVQQLLEAEGYDPENGDLAIIRTIVAPAGRELWSEPPYVLRE